MKKLKGFVVISVSIVAALCLQACKVSFEPYDSIENYRDLIDSVTQYIPPIKDDEPQPPAGLELKGYKLISNEGFDKPAYFYENNYAVTSIGGRKILIDKQGNKYDSPTDIGELIYDKYVYEENGLKGVKDAFGNILLSAKYTSIDISGNNTLACAFGNVYIYLGGNLVTTVPESKHDIALSGDYLIVDYELCDLKLQPIMFGGYRAVDIYDGVAKIKNERERFGFYDIEEKRVTVMPQYYTATQFVNGYAQVRERLGGEYKIIDKQGSVKAGFEYRTYGLYDGYMFAADADGNYRLYDSEFQDTGLSFSEVYGTRVYGKYVVDTSCNRLFSLESKQYVTEYFSEIKPFDNGFLCKNKTCIVYDENLTKLGEFDSVMSDKSIISVLFDGKYYYFSKVSEEN